MNVIVVRKNNKEIGRIVPSKKNVLIGRSPVCDLVIRSQNLKPLHFLIEWLGDGDFDPRSGMWSLVDISQTGKNASYVGEAHIIQTNSLSLNGFDFLLLNDELAESVVSKGVIARSIAFEEPNSSSTISSAQMVLELLTYDLNNDVITHVNHFNTMTLQKGLRIASLPKLFIKVSDPQVYKLTIENQGEVNLVEHFNRLEQVTDLQVVGQSVEVAVDDFHVIKTLDHAFYIRWVPKTMPMVPSSNGLKDPILMTFLGALIFGVLLSLLVKQIPFQPGEINAIQRVARVEKPQGLLAQDLAEIESTEFEKSASPPAAEVINPEPPINPDLPQQNEAAPAIKTIQEAQKGERPQAIAVTSKPLPIKAPVQDVNTIGLLGRLKSKSGTSAAQVRADQVVNQGSPVDMAAGDQGTLTLSQAPMGQVGLRAKSEGGTASGNSKGLESASTSLKTGKVSDSQSVGGILGGSESKFGAKGNALGGKASGEGVGGFGETGKSTLETGAMEVEGGLTKDDIRKALAENRRAIRNCYERSLMVKKDLQGRLTLKWRIAPSGSVVSIAIQSSDLNSPSLDSCVLEIVKGIQFAQAPNKLPTTVIYPFVFQGKN